MSSHVPYVDAHYPGSFTPLPPTTSFASLSAIERSASLDRSNFGFSSSVKTYSSDWITRKEAAAILRLQPQTLAKWASTGSHKLPFYKIGRFVRYRRRDVEEFMLAGVVAFPFSDCVSSGNKGRNHV